MFKKTIDFFLSIWLIGLIFVIWWIVSHQNWVSPYLLPTPESVWDVGKHIFSDGTLSEHLFASLSRSLSGYFLAAIFALVLAYVVNKSELLHKQIRFFLEALRMVPPLSLIPLLILWLGIGEAPKLTIVILASFFPIYLNALSGFKQIDIKYYELSFMLRLTPWEKIYHIEIPGALPSIFTGLRLGFGYSWRALVGAELIAASSGLGFMISEASELARTEEVFIGIISIALLGVLGDGVFQIVVKKLAPWSK